MKKIFFSLSVMLLMTLLMSSSSCERETTSDDVQAKQQEAIKDEAVKEIGMPNIVNFSQMRFAKMVIELCDQANLINYVYTKAEMSGKMVFLGKCVGFGLPYATQYTNPNKIVDFGQ